MLVREIEICHSTHWAPLTSEVVFSFLHSFRDTVAKPSVKGQLFYMLWSDWGSSCEHSGKRNHL